MRPPCPSDFLFPSNRAPTRRRSRHAIFLPSWDLPGGQEEEGVRMIPATVPAPAAIIPPGTPHRGIPAGGCRVLPQSPMRRGTICGCIPTSSSAGGCARRRSETSSSWVWSPMGGRGSASSLSIGGASEGIYPHAREGGRDRRERLRGCCTTLYGTSLHWRRGGVPSMNSPEGDSYSYHHFHCDC